MVLVEVDELMIDILAKGGWLKDGVTDRGEIASAIERLVRSCDQSQQSSSRRVIVGS
jgi:hypothetical protein